MATIKVIGEYVTLKVKDMAGADVLVGYLKGAVVDNVDKASADHHVKNGLAEKFEESVPAPEDPQDPPADPPADEAPKGNASRDEWAAYASSKGAPEDETKPVEEGGLKQTDLREKYGK